MGLTSAFNNAFSGLNASSRRAELVSNNIANAMTEGYARREINLSSDVLNGHGGGVRVADVTRIENLVVSASRRKAEADVSSSTVTSDVFSRLAASLGDPAERGSLAVQFADLDNALLGAANDPSNQSLLDGALDQASRLAQNLNTISSDVNSLRLEMDTKIANSVDTLNGALGEIADLNLEIRERIASGGSVAALKDQQGVLIDKVNSIIPVKVVARDFERVALFTPNGGTLLDDRVVKFDFTKVPAIAHGMTFAGGALSGLIVDGSVADVNSGNQFYDGGELSALFEARDSSLPEFNDKIDALAGDLISRFQNPLVDPTLAPADPGFFTDAGGQYVSANQLGLAGRISLNALVDPQSGGQSWKLRDGLNAVVQGDTGQNAILRNLSTASQSLAAPTAGMGVTASMSAAGFASEIAAIAATEGSRWEDQNSYDGAKFSELYEAERALTSVDTDAELQNLMEVEASYAANARVMSVLDELLNRLLEI